MSNKKTLLLQPIQGKFVQAMVNGKIVRVWLVDPDTNKQGTEIPYIDAITLLALPHPVVCLAQIKGKDGKYIVQIDDEDKEKIAQKKREFENGISSFNSESNNSKDTSGLEKLVETQSLLIQNQQKQMEMMQKQFDKLEKTFEKLSKKKEKAVD